MQVYRYSGRGDLIAAVGAGAALTYGYDGRHLLTRIAVGDTTVWEGSYDDLGHLVSERGPGGTEVKATRALSEDGLVVTLTRGSDVAREHYDDRLRLVRIERDNEQVTYAYDDSGVRQITRPAGGAVQRWRLAREARPVQYPDPRGEVRDAFGSDRQLEAVFVDGRRPGSAPAR